MADIACGKWGTDGGKVTFVQTLTQKGSELVERAIEAVAIEVESPSEGALEARARKQEAAIALARKWQERYFDDLKSRSIEDRFAYWTEHFSQCIKCFGCRDACPICYCLDCCLEADRGLVAGGSIPPDVLFPILRTIHVADSCVNCGQCQDACPSELPLSRLTHMLNVEISSTLEYEPGMDVGASPPLSVVPEAEIAA
jgi:formate dehydrogenase subunit beta